MDLGPPIAVRNPAVKSAVAQLERRVHQMSEVMLQKVTYFASPTRWNFTTRAGSTFITAKFLMIGSPKFS